MSVGEDLKALQLFNEKSAELRAKPFILETPIDQPGDDRRNLDALKRLVLVGWKSTPHYARKALRP